MNQKETQNIAAFAVLMLQYNDLIFDLYHATDGQVVFFQLLQFCPPPLNDQPDISGIFLKVQLNPNQKEKENEIIKGFKNTVVKLLMLTGL